MKYGLEANSLALFFDEDSIWEKKETDKSIVFNCIKKGTHADDYCPTKIVTRKDNAHNNTIKDWWDNTYTVYLNMDWQPLYFYPLT